MKRRNGSYKTNGFVTFVRLVLIVVLFPFVFGFFMAYMMNFITDKIKEFLKSSSVE